MRILMLNHNVAWRGGTFFRAYHFGRHLALRGHRVTLVTTSPTNCARFEESNVDGIRVIEAPDLMWGRARSGWDIWNTLRRIGWVERERYDLIHVFDSRPVAVLPALWHRARHGTKLVLDWADWWGRGGTNAERPGRLLNLAIAPIETFFEEAFRVGADGNTVLSSALYQRALALGVRPEVLMYLIQGSDVERIKPLERAKARRMLGVPASTMLVGHLGVLQPRDTGLIFAAHSIVQRSCPDYKLVLIGRHRCNLAEYRANSDAWFETGPLSYEQLVHYLAACDILLLPLADTLANRARWPSRVNDYLAAGRPVVATAVGDVAALLADHRAGIVAKPQVEEFSAGVLALLRDRELREELGQRARVLAETKLAWPVITKDLEDFYSKLL